MQQLSLQNEKVKESDTIRPCKSYTTMLWSELRTTEKMMRESSEWLRESLRWYLPNIASLWEAKDFPMSEFLRSGTTARKRGTWACDNSQSYDFSVIATLLKSVWPSSSKRISAGYATHCSALCVNPSWLEEFRVKFIAVGLVRGTTCSES